MELNEKEQLIYEMLNEHTLEDTQTKHKEMIDDYEKHGFGDMHPGYIESHKTGLHYTHGYCTGHIELLKKVNNLLKMSTEEILELKRKNEEVKKRNQEYMDAMWERIRGRIDKKDEEVSE